MPGDLEPAVVVLTALELEYRSVRDRLSSVRRRRHPAGTVFEIGRLPDGQGTVAVGLTGVGNTAAAVLTERAVAMFKPRALLFVGVAGALVDDVALGDVVVATKVYAYHGGAEQPHGFRPRPRSWEIPHHLDQIARDVSRAGWATPDGYPHRTVSMVHFRPIAAGEVVLNARTGDLYERLRQTYGDAAAIEMESAGVAQAGHLNDGLPVLTVRGISDRADGRKSEADRHGWQPFAAANAAAFALAVAAAICAAPPEPAARTVAAVPLQAPTDGGVLIGRSAHLDLLDELLLAPGGPQPRIAVLTGMAGVGKTALAAHWAHRAADAFPDGVLYADVRGFGTDQPLRPSEVVAGFLRALGQSRAAERGSLDERTAAFRSAVSGRRILVIMDNVSSVDQVRPLLPGPGPGAVLITSRLRLGGLAVRDGAAVVEVDGLGVADAQALLAAAIGPRAVGHPQPTSDLARRCGGLPLALRIAAERVTSRPFQDLRSLVAELDQAESALDLLGTADDPYSTVRTVFSWSYEGLAEPYARTFRLLGLHPGNPFGPGVVAAILDTSVSDARTMLAGLVAAHLVTESAPDRFAVHDLLRLYARELCARVDGPPDHSLARRRMFDQYLHTADRAGRVTMPLRYRVPLDDGPAVETAFGDRSSALRWFELERGNLVELCRLPDPELDSRRWQLAYVLRDYFYLSKDLDGWVETHRLAVTACERLRDRRAEAITRNNLGRALLESGRESAAAEQYRLAQAIFADLGDEHGRTDSLMNLSSILRRRGDYAAALRDQQLALAYYRRVGAARKVGITLRGIARTELALQRYADAAEHAQEALDAFVHLGLDLDAAQSLNTLARIRARDRQHDLAEAAGHWALEYSQRAGSEHEQARALHELGTIALAVGRPELARQRWTRALELLRALGAPLAATVLGDLDSLGPRPDVSNEAPRPAGAGSSDAPLQPPEDLPE